MYNQSFRSKELVLDLREAEQSPEGIYFEKDLALELVRLFSEANGTYVLLTHPHNHSLSLEKQVYVYERKPENILLGSHFRFHPSKKLLEDETFTTTMSYSDWIGVFLDYSSNGEKRYGLGTKVEEKEIQDLSRSTIQELIKYRKIVRYTLEHGFKSLLEEESLERSLRLIRTISSSGVSWINIPDTTGFVKIEEVRKVLKYMKEYFESENLGTIPIGVHFHNDLGYSLENSVLSLNSFVRYFDVTPLSLGERNGITRITSLAEKINELSNREEYKIGSLKKIEELVIKEFSLDKAFFERQKPSNDNSHKHIAGTHANAILKGVCYKANNGEDKVLFNYQSGASNIILILKERGIEIDVDTARRIALEGKDISIREKGRVLTIEELLRLYKKHK